MAGAALRDRHVRRHRRRDRLDRAVALAQGTRYAHSVRPVSRARGIAGLVGDARRWSRGSAASSVIAIGLTGGIGSGKSTVAARLGALGAAVVDTDAISRALTAAGGDAMPLLARRWASVSWRPTARSTRRGAPLVFETPRARAARIDSAPGDPRGCRRRDRGRARSYLLVVVPLLFETRGYLDRVSRILVVDCPESLQLERTAERSALDADEVRRIMRGSGRAGAGCRWPTTWSGTAALPGPRRPVRAPGRHLPGNRLATFVNAGPLAHNPPNPGGSVILYEYPSRARQNAPPARGSLTTACGSSSATTAPTTTTRASRHVRDPRGGEPRRPEERPAAGARPAADFLDALRTNPAISEEKLNGVLKDIDSAFSNLHATSGKTARRCARTNGSWRSSNASAFRAARASSTCPRTTIGCTIRSSGAAPTSRSG